MNPQMDISGRTSHMRNSGDVRPWTLASSYLENLISKSYNAPEDMNVIIICPSLDRGNPGDESGFPGFDADKQQPTATQACHSAAVSSSVFYCPRLKP